MAKTIHKGATQTLKKQPQTPVNIIYLFFLLAYGFITILTPNLKALDSNGPKFLALAILNLITFLFLFSRKDLKTQSAYYTAFFSNKVGIAYTCLMVISLLSFFKAINVYESILHFAKIFTTFTAAYLISILIIKDKRNVLYLSTAMCMLLVIDSITVFSGIYKYINGIIIELRELVSVYSNKNIFVSSIFVKIPFALYLMIFYKKWIRILGVICIFMALTAVFFMSARAFYIGTFVLSVLVIMLLVIRYMQLKERSGLILCGIYLISLAFSFFIFSQTQRTLYPKNRDLANKSVEDRLSTIVGSDGSKTQRLEGWLRSWHVFKESPFLGVGLGNWKILTLKEENLITNGYSYQIKAHNDFIEITTESGIFGGILFTAIFILIIGFFVQAIFKKYNSDWLSLFFLTAFGLICYSFDAFFNFPQDRPEIQSLFAIYIGISIAAIYLFRLENIQKKEIINLGENSMFQRFGIFLKNSFQSILNNKKNYKGFLSIPLILLFALLMSSTIYVFRLNFKSLKLQSLIASDIKKGKLTQSASIFMDGFPSFPNLSSTAVPIAVQKARYLIKENRNEEAIAILSTDHSNPNDALSKGLMAEAYYNILNIDSSLFYSRIMYSMKPIDFKAISFLCNLLQQKGLQEQVRCIIDRYLSIKKINKEAWLYASSFYYNSGNYQKAIQLIDTAATYFPEDSLIISSQTALNTKVMLIPSQSLYNAATAAYKANNYSLAVRLYSDLLVKIPGFIEALSNRAFSYYFLKEYAKSIKDLEILINEKGLKYSNLYNLRGVNFKNLKNNEEACKYFKMAADKGDKDGILNYSRFCEKGK